jgi:hypothetical protein
MILEAAICLVSGIFGQQKNALDESRTKIQNVLELVNSSLQASSFNIST